MPDGGGSETVASAAFLAASAETGYSCDLAVTSRRMLNDNSESNPGLRVRGMVASSTDEYIGATQRYNTHVCEAVLLRISPGYTAPTRPLPRSLHAENQDVPS